MISDKMLKAYNDQVHAETYSAYLYWSIAAWFESENLPGFAQWMKAQAQEEMSHAMKFYHTIYERGGQVALQALDAPPAKWDTPLAAFEASMEHEKYITSRINDLVDLAIAEKDHAANNFLQWFVAEQVEEEASVDEVIQKLQRIGDHPQALYMLDREMGGRSAGGGEDE